MQPRVLPIACVTALAAAAALAASATGSFSHTAAPPQNARPTAAVDDPIEQRIDQIMAGLSLQQKLGQLQQVTWTADPAGQQQIEDAVRAGMVGAVFNINGAADTNALQHVAVDSSPTHIPLLIGYDTIHGYRTVFPIPLGEAASFDPSAAETDASVGADETAHAGIKQAFAPMVDVSHEPRWGRIAEGAGEDPFLGSVIAAARVRGYQGDDYSAPDKVAATVKHFVAYGQPEGGRDYNTVDVSEQRLRNLYLPPFQAAVQAGVASVMSSFNTISGVPATGNYHTISQILKGEWGFDGLMDSDYTAVQELIAHGFAADGKDAARLALNAGMDMEMVSTNFVTYGEQLVAQGLVSQDRIDDAVRRVLRIKLRAGLFDHPYVDPAQEAPHTLTDADRAAARSVADRSMVLLKNARQTLPLHTDVGSIALIGPLADNQPELLGPWAGQGRPEDVVPVRAGIAAAAPDATINYAPGCTIENPPYPNPPVVCKSRAGFAEAIAAAERSDVIVAVVGEAAGQSGEAAARSDITLPGLQANLVKRLAATGKPLVLVLMNGRPLALNNVVKRADAIVEAWFPGVEGGNAVADVLFGTVNPGGHLPVTFPYSVGQVPIYYNHENTGRPPDPTNKYSSKYIDAPFTPLFPFGYGLSYTTFSVSDLQLSGDTMSAGSGSITATVKVTNTGERAGDDVVQLYVHDPVAQIVQPVRRLRGFQRVTLAAGASQTVTFRLTPQDVGYYDNAGQWVVEPGDIDVYAGDSSTTDLHASFNVVPGG
jgi:beta-glucosidase